MIRFVRSPVQRNVLVISFDPVYSDICIGYISVLLFPFALLCSFLSLERFASLHSLQRDIFYPDFGIQVEPERQRDLLSISANFFFPDFNMVQRVKSR